MAKTGFLQIIRIGFTAILIFFLDSWLAISPCSAQDYQPQWLSLPTTNSGQQLWFTNQIVLNDWAKHAEIVVYTRGKVNIFVNQRNVSTALWIPYRTENDTIATCIRLTITSFLQKGNNTIAINYAPSGYIATQQQIAVSLVGTLQNKQHIVALPIQSWLVKPTLSTILPNQGEWIDANDHTISQENNIYDDVTLWQPATILCHNMQSTVHYGTQITTPLNVKTHKPQYFDVVGDSIFYQFNKTFQGHIRVTLRQTKVGQRIFIDNLTYVCSGETDEQACQQFTVSSHRRVQIYGDHHFQHSQIQSIEGLEIVPYIQEYHWESFANTIW